MLYHQAMHKPSTSNPELFQLIYPYLYAVPQLLFLIRSISIPGSQPRGVDEHTALMGWKKNKIILFIVYIGIRWHKPIRSIVLLVHFIRNAQMSFLPSLQYICKTFFSLKLQNVQSGVVVLGPVGE